MCSLKDDCHIVNAPRSLPSSPRFAWGFVKISAVSVSRQEEWCFVSPGYILVYSKMGWSSNVRCSTEPRRCLVLLRGIHPIWLSIRTRGGEWIFTPSSVYLCSGDHSYFNISERLRGATFIYGGHVNSSPALTIRELERDATVARAGRRERSQTTSYNVYSN